MSIPFLKDDSLAPGAVEQTAPGIRRVLCGNPGPFTYRGTNSWIIGQGNSVAILDPGPVDAAHLAALLDATKGERITHILVTHTHRDHSPGVAALKAATGAPSYGFGPHMTPPEQGGEGGDHDFRPDVVLADGATVAGGGLLCAGKCPYIAHAVQRGSCHVLVHQRGQPARWRYGGLYGFLGQATGA